jgi:phosphonate transport system substrate-binding protein
VVAANAPAQRLQDLEGTRVAFANPYGFTGYSVPLDALLKAGVKVKPVFAGNQEAAMGQLKHGTVQAAGVNSQVMANFAAREKFAYRVLYSSESYYDLCVMAHPDVPEAVRERVRTALTQMAQTPAGWAILLAGAEKIGAAKPKGFVRADEQDYDNYRKFYAQAEPVEQTEPVLEAH